MDGPAERWETHTTHTHNTHTHTSGGSCECSCKKVKRAGAHIRRKTTSSCRGSDTHSLINTLMHTCYLSVAQTPTCRFTCAHTHTHLQICSLVFEAPTSKTSPTHQLPFPFPPMCPDRLISYWLPCCDCGDLRRWSRGGGADSLEACDVGVRAGRWEGGGGFWDLWKGKPDTGVVWDSWNHCRSSWSNRATINTSATSDAAAGRQ